MRLALFLAIFSMCTGVARAEEIMPDGEICTSLVRLLSNPEKYAGKRVVLSGYFQRGFELSGLFLSRDDAISGNTEQAIWIGLPKKGGAEIKYPEKAFIQVAGTFRYTPMQGAGHLGNWFAEIEDVELLRTIPTE